MTAPALDHAFRVAGQGLLLVLLVSAPPLLASLLAGLVTGVLQAATQVQDQTLSFVPKLVAVVLTIILLGPALGGPLVRFTRAVLGGLPAIR